jgi:hypothetical protein
MAADSSTWSLLVYSREAAAQSARRAIEMNQGLIPDRSLIHCACTKIAIRLGGERVL